MNQNIEDDIKFAKQSAQTHSKFNYKASFKDKNNDDVVVNYKGIADTYLAMLKKYSYEEKMDEDEYLDYEYNPRLYCEDKYGNAELWSLLLAINGMYSVMDFNKRSIMIFPDNINALVDEMLIKEEKKLTGLENTFK